MREHLRQWFARRHRALSGADDGAGRFALWRFENVGEALLRIVQDVFHVGIDPVDVVSRAGEELIGLLMEIVAGLCTLLCDPFG